MPCPGIGRRQALAPPSTRIDASVIWQAYHRQVGRRRRRPESVDPGCTRLTVIPRSPRARANPRVKPISGDGASRKVLSAIVDSAMASWDALAAGE
jgi:hypothetical protein